MVLTVNYPKAKYHATEPNRLVMDASEESELGEGWFDHPDLAKVEPEVSKEEAASYKRRSKPTKVTAE